MANPSTYQSLPATYEAAKPLLDQSLQQTAAGIGKVQGSTKQPYPPRGLHLAAAPTGNIVVAWELPVKASDVAGFNVYIGNEFAPAFVIRNPAQLSQIIPLPGLNIIYVSCVNSNGVESQKVGLGVSTSGSSFRYTQDFQQRSRVVGGGS